MTFSHRTYWLYYHQLIHGRATLIGGVSVNGKYGGTGSAYMQGVQGRFTHLRYLASVSRGGISHRCCFLCVIQCVGEMSKSLDELVEKLQLSLEEKPDLWFNSPKGYLSKPDYKRQAQEKAYIDGGGGAGSEKKVAAKRQSIFESISMLATSAYKKRFFVLDKNVNALIYYKDESSTEELGMIDC